MIDEFKKKPRFVFFDLDGTLYDVVAATDAALAAALKIGCDLLELDKELVPHYTKIFWQEYFRYAKEAQTTEPAEMLSVLLCRTLYSEELEAKANQALWNRLARVWIDQFMVNVKPFPQVAELLDRLQKGGIGCGLISNGVGKWQRLKLTALGIDGYFAEENLFFSDEQGLAKPEAGIFQLALDSCALTASETIFVGDSPVTDVPGALAVGLTMIWLNRYELTSPNVGNLPGQLFQVESFSQAAKLINRLLFWN
jgi:HAD superfamily hydrolase (TIGR01549 family)